MVNGMILQSEICSPSANFVFQKVKDNLDAFDQMESSDIVRSLFGIGATNPTAIDMNDGLLSNQSDADKYKLEQALADGGISGIIWRFTTKHKFVVDLCKNWSANGTRWTTLTLVSLVEKPNEPVAVKYRTLVQWKSDAVVFMSKTENVKIVSDFNQADMIKKLHDKFKEELQKEASQQEQPEEPKSRIEFRGHPVKIEENKGIVEKFVEERHGMISPEAMTSLSEMCKWHVRVDNDPNDGHLIFTFPQYKFQVSVGELKITANVHIDLERKVEQFAEDVYHGECPDELKDQFAKGLANYLKAHDFILEPEVGNPRELSEVNIRVDSTSYEYTLVTVNLVTVEMKVTGIKYRVEVFHDGTMKEADLFKVREYLEQNLFKDGNHEFKYECAEHALQFASLSVANWSIDHQEESTLGEVIIKIKYERMLFPLANLYKFEAKGTDFGKDLEAASDSLGKQIGAYRIDTEKDVMIRAANVILDIRDIKDYVVVDAQLEGSDDLDDYKSQRTWVLTFDMTPEAKETERLHREQASQDAAASVVVIKRGDAYYFRPNGRDENTSVDIISYHTGEIVTSFCDPDVPDYQFETDSYNPYVAKEDVTPKMLKEKPLSEIMEMFRLGQPAAGEAIEPEKKENKMEEKNKVIIKKDGLVSIIRDAGERSIKVFNDETREEIMQFDCEGLVEDYNKGIRQFRAMGDITHEAIDIIQSASWEFYNRFAYVDVKVTVSEYLKSCEDSIVAALRDVISTLQTGWDDTVVTEKLREITEMEDLVVTRKEDGSWYVDQEPQDSAPAEAAEEVPSADIHDQEVQLNLLRGLFGVTNPAITHIQTFLRKHLTEIGHDGYAITESFPTETMIAWSEKPYNFVLSIVRFKDGRFYRMFLGYNNPGLADQTWLTTKNVPGRWVKLGNDIQSPEFRPVFHNGRGRR